ncbi:MAG: tRNA (adenosine(37)-N6)-threonylcarbamoyltransferase complex dimerization subunit type 1 TsaB [Rhodobacteraceae bacterium]|nr:tRNA (adenosine(37)-N6)-threonylcarbamoyltransferase complex dimerization subunit type 1 TsaB [Paracoccaceae bacterium]
MRILAIDTALANCAVALVEGQHGDVCLARVDDHIGRGHAERLIPLIDQVLDEAKLTLQDVDRVAVTAGPGSFTGLRVGLSVARGFGLVIQKPVVGISTLSAIAQGTELDQSDRQLFVALTGKGEEIYCQTFGPGRTPVSEACVQKLSELGSFLTKDTLLAGSAAASVATALGVSRDQILNELAFPDILDVAALGALADPKEALAVPLYLRPADATPQKKGRILRA